MQLQTNTKTILSVGFSAIVGLMVILISLSLLSYQSSVKRIEKIVSENNLKNEYITQLRTLARERSISMQKMLLLQDMFDKDEEWINFKAFASEFIKVRQLLLEMPLSRIEQETFGKLSGSINAVGGLQNKIAALILAEKDEEAHQLIVDEALPKQDDIFNKFALLLSHLKKEAKQSVEHEKSVFKNTIISIVSLASCAILASVLIAIILVRRTGRIEKQLYLETERAQVTLYSIGDGVITTDSKGEVEQLNTAAESVTGWRNSLAKGRDIWKIFPMSIGYDQSIKGQLSKILSGERKNSCNGNTAILGNDNRSYDVEYSLSPIFDSNNNIMGSILIFRDVSEIHALAEKLRVQAQHDSLTGLLNRSEFEKQVTLMLEEVRRYPAQSYWLSYLDIDQFKVINDTCGHLAGDELLKQLANILNNQLRSTDFLARLGGDEFAIILKHSDEEQALLTMERVRKAIQANGFCWEDKCFTVTASIGVVQIKENSGNIYDIMSVVDAACYVSKDEGRNRVHFVKSQDDESLQRKGEMDWVHRIKLALEQDRFTLYYQPIKPLKESAEEFHAEILVRLFDDEGNLVPPNSFIPAAERYNIMTQIDEWIVNKAFDFISKNFYKTQVVSINLSAQSLCGEDFMQYVVDMILEKKVNPVQVCFEITETAAIANLSHATRFITTLRELGCKFSLDDFGSGLSSFGYLKTLKVDYLKIDGAFVKNLENDQIDLAMVTSINQVGKVMGLETIAEFVENKEIETILKRIGVDFAQGFGIAKPQPLDGLVEKLNKKSGFQQAG